MNPYRHTPPTPERRRKEVEYSDAGLAYLVAIAFALLPFIGLAVSGTTESMDLGIAVLVIAIASSVRRARKG